MSRCAGPGKCIKKDKILLNDKTDQPTLAVIDDLLPGFLQFSLALLADDRDLRTDPVLHQLLDGFSENVRLPDRLAPLFPLLDVGCLLYTSDAADEARV